MPSTVVHRRRLLITVALALPGATGAVGAWMYRHRSVTHMEHAQSLVDDSWRTVTIEPFRIVARVPDGVICSVPLGQHLTRCTKDKLSIEWTFDLPSEKLPPPAERDDGIEDIDNKEGGGGMISLGEGAMLGFQGYWAFDSSSRMPVHAYLFWGWKNFGERGLGRLLISAEGRTEEPTLGLAIALTTAPGSRPPAWLTTRDIETLAGCRFSFEQLKADHRGLREWGTAASNVNYSNQAGVGCDILRKESSPTVTEIMTRRLRESENDSDAKADSSWLDLARALGHWDPIASRPVLSELFHKARNGANAGEPRERSRSLARASELAVILDRAGDARAFPTLASDLASRLAELLAAGERPIRILLEVFRERAEMSALMKAWFAKPPDFSTGQRPHALIALLAREHGHRFPELERYGLSMLRDGSAYGTALLRNERVEIVVVPDQVVQTYPPREEVPPKGIRLRVRDVVAAILRPGDVYPWRSEARRDRDIAQIQASP